MANLPSRVSRFSAGLKQYGLSIATMTMHVEIKNVGVSYIQDLWATIDDDLIMIENNE